MVYDHALFRASAKKSGIPMERRTYCFLYVGLAKFARLSDQPAKRRAIRKPCPLRKIDLASTRPELVLALAREMAAALPAPH